MTGGIGVEKQICYLLSLLFAILLTGCGKTETQPAGETAEEREEAESDSMELPEESMEITAAQEEGDKGEEVENMKSGYADYFSNLELAENFKGMNDANPLMTQRFGADPYAMVYDGRVYFYMTADAFEYKGGEIAENSYGKITGINVISTSDMVNFTDHGAIRVAGKEGAADWAHNSWAPAAAWKEIDGQDKFFLYFADGGGGIGVLTADSPTGPFTDPLGHGLVTRQTPNCADVLWLFDPAVLVDEDGRAYLYFGGGVPEGKEADPGTARVVELGEDMISLKGEPRTIDVPYLFEDSGIHKYKDKYYYTYCTNWQVDEKGTEEYGIHNAEIACMESDSPMGPFTYKEMILENPGSLCGLYGNNHHCVFSFQEHWYITYHARTLEKAMDVEKGYRCTHVDSFTMGEDGTIGTIPMTMKGREQLTFVNPYQEMSAAMMAVQGGLETVEADAQTLESGAGNMAIAGIDSGDFLKIQGVDFGAAPPTGLEVTARYTEGTEGLIQVRLDDPEGQVLGYMPLGSLQEAQAAGEDFQRYTAPLESEATGVHDLYFIFYGSGYQIGSWKLTEGLETVCPEEAAKKAAEREYGSVEHITYDSKTTGLERGANVLLPAGYDSEKQYPVLYFLHGIFGDEYSLINDGNNAIPEILGNLSAEGKAPEVIVVFPDMYATSDPEQKPGFTDEAVAPYDNFINDLVNDLIPCIESRYSVLAKREGRGILGFSMGGRESLFIGVTRPDLFGYIGAIAPAPGLTPAKDWAMSHPGQLEEKDLCITDQVNLPELLMVCCGTKDSVVGQFPSEYHRLLEQNGTEHLWYEVPEADHDSRAIRSGLYNFMLRFRTD